MKIRLDIRFALFLVVIAMTVTCFAASSQETPDALKGLKGVEIIDTNHLITSGEFEVVESELLVPLVKELNELNLLFASPDMKNSEVEDFQKMYNDLKKVSDAKLYVSYTTFTLPNGSLLIETNLEVYDMVTLKRAPKQSFNAQIWATGSWGFATLETKNKMMSQQLELCVGKFSKAFVKANRS
ncbi:MAG: hypothetical protein RLZ87_93 [Armatimonadota bacterium]